MAVNPDPRPGRWILPLVILGMIAFTYFFVRELPEASPEPTVVAAPDTTTTTLGETGTTAPATEDPPAQPEVDPETQAYLAELDQINQELQLLGTEMVTINEGFDADPREIEYGDAEDRLEALEANTQALADRLAELAPPADLEVNQTASQNAIDLAVLAAGDALAGLRSSDDGSLRRNAREAYAQAVDSFNTEVANTHNAAGTEA